MNIRELTYVALKITGILSFLWGLRLWESTVSLVSFLDKDTFWSVLLFIVSIIPFIFTMVISFFLLAKTNRVIEWLSLPDHQEEPNEIKVEAFMSAAFAILGITLLIIGISKLIYIPGQIMALAKFSGQQASGIKFRTMEMIVEMLIMLVLGLYLFFGGDGLIGFWKRYREKTKLIDY